MHYQPTCAIRPSDVYSPSIARTITATDILATWEVIAFRPVQPGEEFISATTGRITLALPSYNNDEPRFIVRARPVVQQRLEDIWE